MEGSGRRFASLVGNVDGDFMSVPGRDQVTAPFSVDLSLLPPSRGQCN